MSVKTIMKRLEKKQHESKSDRQREGKQRVVPLSLAHFCIIIHRFTHIVRVLLGVCFLCIFISRCQHALHSDKIPVRILLNMCNLSELQVARVM